MFPFVLESSKAGRFAGTSSLVKYLTKFVVFYHLFRYSKRTTYLEGMQQGARFSFQEENFIVPNEVKKQKDWRSVVKNI